MKKTLSAFAFVLFTAATASAGPVNMGFEAGLTGWSVGIDPTAFATVVGSFDDGDFDGGSPANPAGPVYLPYGGSNFLVMSTGAANFTEVSSNLFTLLENEEIGGVAAFTTTEADAPNPLFNDNAAVQIIYWATPVTPTVVATPWTASVEGFGDGVGLYGNTPWTPWSFVAGVAGTYSIVYTVVNQDDANFDSFALFDAGPANVPDGGSALAMLGLGMIGLGAIRRRFNI
jgi:hypothetical protein